MSNVKSDKTVLLYSAKPREDLKLPPMTRRPYEQSTGKLQQSLAQPDKELVKALSNLRPQ